MNPFLWFVHLIKNISLSKYPWLILLGITLLLRVASFFIDYLYPDMIVSVVYRNGLNGGWELIPHKGLVYTWFLDFTFNIFGYNARSLHIMSFFLTYIQSILVYILAKNLGYKNLIAYASAFIFVIVSSTALPEIFVPNGEQLYMLFFLLGFIYFSKAYFDKQYLYYIGLFIAIFLAVKTKDTGIWLPLTLMFCIYVDISKTLFKTKKAIFISLLLAFVVAISILVGVFYIALSYPEIKSLQWLAKAWDYIRVYPKVNFVKWVVLLFLPFVHPFLFLFPIANFLKQLKYADFTKKQLYLYNIAFCLFISGFAGGTRLYQHYFFPLYPIFSIFVANYIYQYALVNKIKPFCSKVGNISLLHTTVMIGVYIYWALLVNPLKELYFKYPEFTPNSYSIYLYPNQLERSTLAFLKQEKEKNPKLEIYIWPIGHVMGYFSKLPFKIGPYIDVSDNRCMLYYPITQCAKERVDSFFTLNKSGDIFVEYRGILANKTFSHNKMKFFFQKGMSSHQNLFDKTEQFALELEKEMEKRGAVKILNLRDALYLWKKP